jgi:hypothetical protein
MKAPHAIACGAVVAALSALVGCATVPVAEEVASLRIARREGPAAWSADRERPAAPPDLGPDRLAQALRFCRKRQHLKFEPRWRVTLVDRDGRETEFHVLGRRVMVHGISYECSEDVEALAQRRWTGR